SRLVPAVSAPLFSFYCYGAPRALHSFPTRRSSDLPVHPGIADDPREAYPDGRAAQMRGIADEFVAVQPGREEFFAIGDALFLAHVSDAGSLPGFFGGLDNEGRQHVFEAVGVRLEPAVVVFYEREGESVEYLGGAQPHKAAAAGVDVGPEGVGVAGPHQAVDAIRSNDQVGVILLRHRLVVLHIGFEHQLHTHVFAALLQDVQQLFAADADKAVPVRAHAAALEVDVDVVPVV